MSRSGRYLLRVEGVNLANVIDDTDQLSVRRGGGLMVLNVATELKELLPQEVGSRLRPIATGASIGLFEFEAAGDDEQKQHDDAARVRQAVDEFLKAGCLSFHRLLKDHKFEENESQLPLKHGTFVVDIVGVDEERGETLPSWEQQAEQLAVAKNRWRQLQQPTMSLDGLWDQGMEPCTLDRTRVANSTCDLPEHPQAPVAKSCRTRREYGRGARQQFYQTELADEMKANSRVASILGSAYFTDDLKQLSGKPGEGTFDVPDQLVDKIAVFYVDGNKFGQRGRDIFRKRGAEGFREWSAALRAHHRKLLAGLLTLAESSPETWKNGDEYRIETLLWGGDEIVWVVPAWQGWTVAKWFFSQPHAFQVAGQREELTYACGLVFCHAKAPIKNTTALAHKLGDLAKAARPGVHSLAYEVLESFDDVSGDLEEHRQRFLPAGTPVGELVIDPTKLDGCWDLLTSIRNSTDLPIRQLYRLCAAWRRGEDYKAPQARLAKACEDSEINVAQIMHDFGDPVGWLHLLQMLPYLPLTPQPSAAAEIATTAEVQS
jgi:hypothetical protein